MNKALLIALIFASPAFIRAAYDEHTVIPPINLKLQHTVPSPKDFPVLSNQEYHWIKERLHDGVKINEICLKHLSECVRTDVKSYSNRWHNAFREDLDYLPYLMVYNNIDDFECCTRNRLHEVAHNVRAKILNETRDDAHHKILSDRWKSNVSIGLCGAMGAACIASGIMYACLLPLELLPEKMAIDIVYESAVWGAGIFIAGASGVVVGSNLHFKMAQDNYRKKLEGTAHNKQLIDGLMKASSVLNVIPVYKISSSIIIKDFDKKIKGSFEELYEVDRRAIGKESVDKLENPVLVNRDGTVISDKWKLCNQVSNEKKEENREDEGNGSYVLKKFFDYQDNENFNYRTSVLNCDIDLVVGSNEKIIHEFIDKKGSSDKLFIIETDKSKFIK